MLARGKDVPDGKQFRKSELPSKFAPGHKTMEGFGKSTPEEIKRKKKEKQERKHQQAMREERNRLKRQREQGLDAIDDASRPIKTPRKDGDDVSSQAAERPNRREKKNANLSEEDRRRNEFRNKLNCCMRNADFKKAIEIVKDMETENFTLDQQQYAQMFNLCASSGEDDWKEGEKMLDKLNREMRESKLTETSNDEKNLASGIVKFCSCTGKHKEALETWTRMVEERVSKGVIMIRTNATNRDMEAMFDVYKDSQTEDVDLLEEDFLNIIKACVATKKTKRIFEVLEAMMELIYSLQPETLQSLKQVFESMDRRCKFTHINDPKGFCPECKKNLISLDLTKDMLLALISWFQDELSQLCDQINSLARVGDAQSAAFDAFKSWLNRSSLPDVIIDGANVGYYSLRPDQGEKLSYMQVDKIVQWFKERKMKPLLVMHSRHFHKDALKDKPQEASVVQRLVQMLMGARMEEAMEEAMNDDWFWLYAGAWCSKQKGKVFIVSNDQMRDHHFQASSLHWVNFHFDERHGASDPVLAFPSDYSYRMQPRQDDQAMWHFPSATKQSDWLCCAI
ncbi:hypothetical protein GUITHDRAFT_110991 [Guillardia theta CCMP2712]|uniref:ribonuclease P n=1 Tax=Guillardia theta (strain CCMP2712) TaxID=905079 RepID=L1J4D0_GUITC|nr:hypothetical protein GUITHDRAFT_110991 [Guillardia theta CCMP2712]EKX42945.1 hypothetical protein GUITHDRAFT_110991 [Guillardia theta CCMP2712]|eukprot:XP_005829925.1 hypothetical protein GUITHDRAFT_110991 [Guillardia theta CCMP2712]